MGYLRHIHRINQYNADHFLSFVVDGAKVGEVKHAFARRLLEFSPDFLREADALHWDCQADDFEGRNRAMDEMTDRLLIAGLVPYRHGELYPVTTGDRNQPLFLMDRALAPWFGVRAFGQHMNGYVRRNGEIFLWVGKRSLQKRNEPGKLDNMVAGGLPWNLGLEDNLVKECWEEAGIPAELAITAQPTGHIAYRCEIDKGLKPDIMYTYDLELPEDFTPRCTDGEVDEFYLWPLERVARTVHDTDEVKYNCNLVIIDFLMRHGYITEEHPEYQELIAGLR
jgi:8-oxo-dGTP pyrophosphatase MutT (NUDIX family)